VRRGNEFSAQQTLRRRHADSMLGP